MPYKKDAPPRMFSRPIHRLSACLDAMPLLVRLYLFIVFMLILVVGLAEFILEPLAKHALEGIYGGFQPWHEVIIWIACILFPTLVCGYILARSLSVRLDAMVRASRQLANGNLETRLPFNGNDKDAFDLLARSFNGMAGSIERQFNNERRLLADISHELRSPLTRMALATELLYRKNGTADHGQIALRLEKEVNHMSELVSLLLTQGRERLNASALSGTVDVSAVLAELVEDLAFQAEAHGRTVEARIDGGLSAPGNPLLMQRMLGNILSNAVFYTPENSKVEVTARSVTGGISVSVRDYGPGVPDDQLEDIFRAFYRVDSSRARASGGVGLGLALAREAALALGGSIHAVNALPGLRVLITLPVAEPNPHA